jgi:hypothetical protein
VIVFENIADEYKLGNVLVESISNTRIVVGVDGWRHAYIGATTDVTVIEVVTACKIHNT